MTLMTVESQISFTDKITNVTQLLKHINAIDELHWYVISVDSY